MKCDRCKANVKERYQCGNQWLCLRCLPNDIFKRYPQMKKLREVSKQ